MIYILIFILTLGLIILIHEFGHFIFARRAGILCHEFSIGMGPVLWKKKRGETVYSLRAIPIGGFVAMAGEDVEFDRLKKGKYFKFVIVNNVIRKIIVPEINKYDNTSYGKVVDYNLYGKNDGKLFIKWEDDEGVEHYNIVDSTAHYVFGKNQEYQIAPYDRCFESKNKTNRFLVTFMGAGMNFLFAFLMFFLVALIGGTASNSNEIGQSFTDLPASIAGIQGGDKIIEINGEEVDAWDDISKIMRGFDGTEINIKVDRNGEIKTFNVVPMIEINTLGVASDENTLTDTVIGGVGGNSKADKIGMEAGDRITAINGVVVTNWFEISDELSKYLDNDEISISYERNGETKTKDVILLKALYEEDVTRYVMGISPLISHSFFGSIGAGFNNLIGIFGSVIDTFKLLFTNDRVGFGDLAGPVGIFDMTKTVAMSGFISLLSWLAFLSANIGLVNLLPLPALDGGRLIFITIEAISGKQVDRRVESYIHNIGFLLLMILFVFITGNDILRLMGLK